MSQQTILVIEDEHSLVDVLSYNLGNEGFEVLSATDGVSGLQRAKATLPDLIVLDLMLPGLDGLEVCRRLRSEKQTRDIRVLMLTAKTEELDEVVGFSVGADDYVAKPFKLKALIQRIKALLRRPSLAHDENDIVASQGVEVDRRNHVARMNGRNIQLTPTEFRMLWTLVRQPGRTFSRIELIDICRGEDANALERTIDVHVRALRKQLGNDSGLIETVRGVGYRFRGDA
ncbi:MAG: DNA-binding response regulator [Planctomycetaceae bacterium]|nr:DNA-binding response regulator [Planctomycetaceae bacterium]